MVSLEAPASAEAEGVTPAVDVAPPAPPRLDAAAESEADSHPVDEESPDNVLETRLEAEVIVELAKVVDAPSEE